MTQARNGQDYVFSGDRPHDGSFALDWEYQAALSSPNRIVPISGCIGLLATRCPHQYQQFSTGC